MAGVLYTNMFRVLLLWRVYGTMICSGYCQFGGCTVHYCVQGIASVAGVLYNNMSEDTAGRLGVLYTYILRVLLAWRVYCTLIY